MRFAILAVVSVVAIFFPRLASADSGPEFRLGFKLLADQIPEEVGQPLEEEHWVSGGVSVQATTKGLMVWNKAQNWTAFTNGWWTWVNGPFGVQDRPNGERFDWEVAAAAVAAESAPTSEPPQSRPVGMDNAVEYRYYDLRGRTAGELLAGMESSPCGSGEWGCTSWNYSVSYYRRPDGSYALPQGAPYYHIRVLLPRWTPPPDVPRELIAAWQRMVAALEAHEKKHVEIALADLTSLREAIERAHGPEEAEAALRAGKLRIEQDQQYYDWVTEHGKKEGIAFP